MGPAGTGKTCIARFLARRLRRATLDVETAYVNCWRQSSTHDCLHAICEDLRSAVDLHRTATPESVLVGHLRDLDRQAVVVLDEVDQLDDLAVLYDLHGAATISLVLIANRETALFDRFDERIASRFRGARRVTFDPYGVAELVRILEPRADAGLERRSVAAGTLEVIADTAAGDARAAITLLRLAAEYAEAEGLARITPGVVDAVEDDARRERRQKDLSKLSRHQRIVYECVEDLDGAGLSDVLDEYRSRVSDPRCRRTVRRYLRKMRDYHLIRAEGSTSAREFEVI